MRVTNLHWSLSGYTPPRSVCHLNPNPKFILTSFYINIIQFLQFPPGGTKSPPGQRSGAESVRRAGGVKIPVFISIPSFNPLPFIPSLPSLQFPPLRSGHFRSGSSVFFFSLILLRMFVSFSRQIPFRYAPWSFSRFLTHLLRATIFRTFLKSLLMKLVANVDYGE